MVTPSKKDRNSRKAMRRGRRQSMREGIAAGEATTEEIENFQRTEAQRLYSSIISLPNTTRADNDKLHSLCSEFIRAVVPLSYNGQIGYLLSITEAAASPVSKHKVKASYMLEHWIEAAKKIKLSDDEGKMYVTLMGLARKGNLRTEYIINILKQTLTLSHIPA